MSVRYTAYKLTDKDENLLVETDFQSNLSVKQSVIRQVLADLQSLTVSGGSTNKSQLSINWNGQSLNISRDYQTQNLVIEPQTLQSAELTSWRNNFINVPAELNPQISTQLVSIAKRFGQADQSQSLNVDELKKKVVELGGEQGSKYLELKQKIDVIDAALGSQKRIDENVLSLGELETALSVIEGQISSVHNLLEKQAQINQTLAKYGQMAQQDLEAESVKLRDQLDKLRQEQLVISSKEKGFDPIAASKVTESNLKKEVWHATYLAVLGILTLIIGIGAFIIAKNPILILIATLITLTELILFGALNYIPSQVDVRNILQATPDQPELLATPEVENKDEGIIAKLEKFFLDKAWISALKSESKYMADTISTKLAGKEIAELQTAQQTLKKNIEDLKLEVEKFKANEIPPQEYLQKRRELDMLNIDKARVEREIRNFPNGNEVLDLIFQIDEAGRATEQGGFEIEPELATALGVEDIDPKTETDKGLIYATVLWYRLKDWQQSPQTPLVVVEPLTPWPNSFKVLVDNKLSELRALGQIVIIQLLP